MAQHFDDTVASLDLGRMLFMNELRDQPKEVYAWCPKETEAAVEPGSATPSPFLATCSRCSLVNLRYHFT